MSAGFYSENAERFFADTVGIDMGPLYAPFLARLPAGAVVLDAGCGSGRDARAFRQRGYAVVAFDPCRELAALARAHAGVEVAVRGFDDVDEVAAYDGIWCCASLLHVPAERMAATLARLWRALRPEGCLYGSWKQGHGARAAGGRTFTDADEATVRAWLGALDGARVETWVTANMQPGRTDAWVNALAARGP